jgi:acyl-CoA synthetase (AMP-forming)/AMP-acid ligase II
LISLHTNVTDFLLDGKPADRIALQLIDEQRTYGDLNSAAEVIARTCMNRGLQKGERVVLLAENSFFWVAVYLGVLRAGLVSVPLPVTISSDDLEYVIETTRPKMAAVQAAHLAKHGQYFSGIHLISDDALQRMSGLSQSGSGEPGTQNVRPAAREVHPDDLAALMFTSGSTGRPRGVMVSHRNIMANTESIIQYLELDCRDRIMTVLPFHYCFGTSLLHTHLRVGAALVLDSRFMYPETVLQRMIDTECTAFAGVPSHFQILLRSSSLRKKRFTHLRYVQQAGGHLAPTFIRELQEALPDTRIFVMYGQTEGTARLSFLPPELLNTKSGSIGKGIPGVKLRVLNQAGLDVIPSEIGEIVAEGENITLGYWGDPAETAATYREGRLHTGDLATIDGDGFVYVVDRAKEFVKCGGKRVSCRHVEDRFLECDALVEVAAVPIPDDILGEALKVFVVPRFSDTDRVKEQVRQFYLARIPSHLHPREIIVLKSLPKNAAGKVLRRSLRGI